jgi:MFS family permease
MVRFFLYGVLAGIVLNKLFFPADDPTTSLMLTYATFAVGFLTRPLGGIIFGHFGDRIGRKSVLVATLMIMGVSTFAIGMIPTYDQIGFWAPALLLTMRIFGHWSWWRVGRGSPDGLRVCAGEAAWFLYQHPADRVIIGHPSFSWNRCAAFDGHVE